MTIDTRDEAARQAARKLYLTANDDVQIDRNAVVSHLDEAGTGVEDAAWVQAWVFVPSEEIDKEVGAPVAFTMDGKPSPS